MNTIDQAKSAAKRMHAVLKEHHDTHSGVEVPKLSQAQALLAAGMGQKDWHALEKAAKDGSVQTPSSAAFTKIMQDELEKAGIDRAQWTAIGLCDAMLEPGGGYASADEAIRSARPSITLLAAEHGWFPGLGGVLGAKAPRGGSRRIDGMPVKVDVRKSWEQPEELGLYVVDGAWHLSDANGIAAIVHGVGYVPAWDLDDSEAVLAADAESDSDADTVSAIVTEDPDAFMMEGAVFHLRGIEVRPDLRGRGIARKLLIAAMTDIGARRKTEVITLSYDPEELLAGKPARRVTPAIAEELPQTISHIMDAILIETDIERLEVSIETTTDAQNMMRIGHLVSGGALGDEERLSPEQAEMRLMRSQRGLAVRVSEHMGERLGVIPAADYPDGRNPIFHTFPNIVIDPPADMLSLLGEGAVKLEIITAPKRLNQVVNYTDEPGSYRVHYADGEVIEIANDRLEQELSALQGYDGKDSRRSVAAANLRLVVRMAHHKENDRDADIVHRRVLTSEAFFEETDPPLAVADAVIRAVSENVDDAEVDRRYRAVAASIAKEGMLVDQRNAVAETNGGRTIPWKDVGIIGGRRYDPSTIRLVDLFAVPLSPTIERFYQTGYDRHEAMNHRIIEVAKNYLCEVLDDLLAKGVGGGVTRDQLALDIRFVRAWRSLTRDTLALRIHVPIDRIGSVQGRP